MEPPDVDVEVVIAGRSNAGKSSVLRGLTGHDFDVGRRPGVTLEPNTYDYGDIAFTELPGFGFMSGVDEGRQEEIKDDVVAYLEDAVDRGGVAVHVVDLKSFSEVFDRWIDRGEVPYDLDLHDVLVDLGYDVVVAANKTDKLDDLDGTLDGVADRLGYPPPWRQWNDVFAPTCAKRGSIETLRDLLRDAVERAGRPDLVGRV
ncbi:MAG: GTP-binding protein EngB [Halobacteriales archaeon]